MRYPSPDQTEPPQTYPSQERKRRRSVTHVVGSLDEKEWTATHLWKKPVSIASLEIVWDHVPPTKPYDVRDVYKWAYMW